MSITDWEKEAEELFDKWHNRGTPIKERFVRLFAARLRELGAAISILGGELKPDGSLVVNAAKFNAVHRCEEHRKQNYREQDLDHCVPCVRAQLSQAQAEVARLKNWREMVSNNARPGDVANIILERDDLRQQLADRERELAEAKAVTKSHQDFLRKGYVTGLKTALESCDGLPDGIDCSNAIQALIDAAQETEKK